MAANKTLTDADVVRNAQALGVPRAAMYAILDVEAPKGGFQPDGQVTILFERHYFHRFTGGKFDKTNPDISAPSAGGWGKYSEQHDKLQRAVALDRTAALQSASWGKPQIMGANWALTGASSLQDFINKMAASEGAQVDLLAGFIRNNSQKSQGLTLLQALRAQNWPVVARIYNGPNFADNQYDTKLAAAFKARS